MKSKKIQSSFKHKRNIYTNDVNNLNQKTSYNLENLVNFKQTLYMEQTCNCNICNSKPLNRKNKYDFKQQTNSNSLYQIIKLLVSNPNRSLKVFIPELCFFQNGIVKDLYYTNSKDNRIMKQYCIITENNIPAILNKYRNIYMDSLRLVFENSLKNNKTQVKQVHQNYYNSVFPSYYYDGLVTSSGLDSKTITKKKNVIIHKNSKNISDFNKFDSKHKADQYSYVCKYNDQNQQLFNQPQFRIFINNLHEHKHQILYIKSFIKPKSQNLIITTEINLSQPNLILYEKAKLQVGILFQEVSIYDERYINPQQFEDYAQELKLKPKIYTQYMSYKLIIYLQKFLKKTKFIKLRWVANELNNFYLIDVLQWEYEDILIKLNKNNLVQQNNHLLTSINNDQNFFIETFKSIYKKKQNFQDSPIKNIYAQQKKTNYSTIKKQIRNRKNTSNRTIEIRSSTTKKQNRYSLEPLRNTNILKHNL